MKLKLQNNIPLLSTLNIDGQSFTDFRCSIYEDKSKLFELIQHLNNLPYDTLYFDAFHEVINFKIFKDNGLLGMIENECNKKVIFLDNNIADNFVPDSISYISKPYFLGINAEGERKVARRKFGKHFLCLNYHERPHREEMYRFFYDNNLFDKTYFTFKPWDNSHPYCKNLDSEDITEFETFESTQKPLFQRYEYKTLDEHQKSFCSVVTETFFDKESIKDYHNVTFITEKIEKCIAAGQPFILVGTPGYLKKLHELGFKTFDKWWDESYDKEEDINKRTDKIINIVKEISTYSLDKLISIRKDMEEILKHNNQTIKKLEQTQSQYFDYKLI